MTFISVSARVVTDSTGAISELPVLLTPTGVLQPLLDYCLARSHDRSLSWMRKVVQATTLFLQYLKANPDEPDPHRLFQNFAQRLYSGTFDLTTGLDPSNLCWLEDVFPTPENSQSATVLIHHPHLGYAPGTGLDAVGKKSEGNRARYLAEKFGLRPRTELLSSQRAGWKNPRLDNSFYMTVFWFQPSLGEWFMDLWQRYLEQVVYLERDHPFAFINLHREPRGSMYTIDKFTKAHGAAIERLGMTVRKQLGTTPHGHRHAYGQRLKNGGVDPLLIQRCMHHVSEESQRVYTQATLQETVAALQETVAALQDATRRIADRTAGLNVIPQTKEGWQPPPKT